MPRLRSCRASPAIGDCHAGADRSRVHRARRARRSTANRSASPVGCAGPRRPTSVAAPRASVRYPTPTSTRNRSRSRISLTTRPAISSSRSESCIASTTGSASAIGQLHEFGQPAALHAHGAALRTQTRTVARRTRLQRAIRLEPLLVAPRPVHRIGAADSGSRLRSPRRTGSFGPRGFVAGRRPGRRTAGVALFLRQLAERHLGVDAERPLEARSISSIDPLSPLAHGTTAPAASANRLVGDDPAGSKSYTAPSPWHSGQAPCGELNENARGVISGMLMPHDGQAMRRENNRSPPSSVLMTTMSSASLSATRSTPPVDARCRPLTIRRSTSTSIL